MTQVDQAQMHRDIQQLRAQIAALAQALGQNVQQTNRSTSVVRLDVLSRSELIAHTDQLIREVDGMASGTRQQKEQLKKAVRDMAATSREIAKLRHTLNNRAMSQEDINKTLELIQRHEITLRQKQVKFEQEKLRMDKQHDKKVRQREIMLGTVIATATASYDVLSKMREQAVTGGGAMEKLTDDGFFFDAIAQQNQAIFDANIPDPAVFTKIMGDLRQVVTAKGGTQKTLEEVYLPYKKQLFLMTNSFEDALKLGVKSVNMFVGLGVRPSQQALTGFYDDVQRTAIMSGMTAEATQQFYEDLASDTDVMWSVITARESERNAILATQRRMVQANNALGMLPKNAAEFAKTLAKMSGQKAIDRFSMAQRIRVYGAATGIQGTEAAARDLMIGNKNSEALQEWIKKAIATQEEAVTTNSGSVGKELLFQQLMSSLNLEDLLFKNTQLTQKTNVEALDSNKTPEQIAEMFTKSQESASMNAFYIGQQIGAVIDAAKLNGTYLKAIVDAVGGIAAMIGAKYALDAVRDRLPGGGGGGGGGGGLRGLLGRGTLATAGVVGAAMVGWEVGTLINDNFVEGTKAGEIIGSGIANTLALFGNDEAAAAVATMDKLAKSADQAATNLASTKPIPMPALGVTFDAVKEEPPPPKPIPMPEPKVEIIPPKATPPVPPPMLALPPKATPPVPPPMLTLPPKAMEPDQSKDKAATQQQELQLQMVQLNATVKDLVSVVKQQNNVMLDQAAKDTKQTVELLQKQLDVANEQLKAVKPAPTTPVEQAKHSFFTMQKPVFTFPEVKKP